MSLSFLLVSMFTSPFNLTEHDFALFLIVLIAAFLKQVWPGSITSSTFWLQCYHSIKIWIKDSLNTYNRVNDNRVCELFFKITGGF